MEFSRLETMQSCRLAWHVGMCTDESWLSLLINCDCTLYPGTSTSGSSSSSYTHNQTSLLSTRAVDIILRDWGFQDLTMQHLRSNAVSVLRQMTSGQSRCILQAVDEAVTSLSAPCLANASMLMPARTFARQRRRLDTRYHEQLPESTPDDEYSFHAHESPPPAAEPPTSAYR